jgi:hypothetical protein
MTNTWRRIVAFLAAVPMAMSGVASASIPTAGAPAETAWTKAVQQGSLEAYAEFAMTYPDSKYAKVAYARLSSVGTVSTADHAATKADHMGLDLGLDSVSEPAFLPTMIMTV